MGSDLYIMYFDSLTKKKTGQEKIDNEFKMLMVERNEQQVEIFY